MAAPLLIRADASTQIGTGHVMRCLALAQRWRATGGTAVFACCELTPALATRLENEGLQMVRLDATTGSESDATQTLALAARLGVKWIAADGYAFGTTWQRQVTGGAFKLLVIDDYGHAEHYFADVVLNQNASASAALYEKREAHTCLLLGNKYTLLREEFLSARPGPYEAPSRARKILVTLGGGDPDDVTSMVIDALASLSDIEVTVVVGGSNPHLEKLQRAVAQHAASMRLVVNATNMPDLMAWADLAISAAGSTSWELAFFGVPSALVVVADNQLGIASSLNDAGFSLDLGRHTTTSPQKIASTIAPFLEEAARRREMSARGRQLVDGHGARRVAAALGAPLTITLISDEHSWLNASLDALKSTFEHAGHRVRWVHRPADIEDGDIAFLLSLGQIVPASVLQRNAHNLVVHESALPHGRGWSPLTWQILEGKNEIPITLFEAGSAVDSGCIYLQDTLLFSGHELVHELRASQAQATLRLCRAFVERYPEIAGQGRPQQGTPSHYPRRRPEDSRLDPDKTLREQFNLLRVADPERYPAFFEMNGHRFDVRVHRVDDIANQSSTAK
jgi:UDP-2,4-diacetamido-2,4,6-trideoxy-beta-L-altropyranose hydrolase